MDASAYQDQLSPQRSWSLCPLPIRASCTQVTRTSPFTARALPALLGREINSSMPHGRDEHVHSSYTSPVFGRCRLICLHQRSIGQLQLVRQCYRIDRMGITKCVCLVQPLAVLLRGFPDQRISVL